MTDTPPVHLPPLCAILDADASARAGWTVTALARAVLAGGARFLQIRAKALPGGALLDTTVEIVALARPVGALVIVNDRADIATLASADGVHVGQEDLSVEAVRRLLGPEAIVGVSTHTPAQLDAACARPASYVAVGPVFGTATKATGYDAVGLDAVTRAARHPALGSRPIVAIGGITLERAPAVLAAGAASVAVIGDLLATGDPEARTRAYVERLRV